MQSILLQIDQTIYDFGSGGQFIGIAYSIADKVKSAVIPVASGIIGILMIVEFFKVIFGEGQVSWLKLIKLFVFLMAFYNYDALVRGFHELLQGILNGLGNYETSTQANVFGKDITLTNTVANEVDNEFFLVTLAKKAMSLLQLVSQVLLIAMGPLAITISFIPGQEGVFVGWFRNLAHVLLWSFTFMILDLITTHMSLLSTKETVEAVTDHMVRTKARDAWDIAGMFADSWSFQWDLIASNAENWLTKGVLCIGYFATPWLTSKYMGTAHSGGFVRQMMGTAGAMWAGAKMASATNIKNTVNAGKTEATTIGKGAQSLGKGVASVASGGAGMVVQGARAAYSAAQSVAKAGSGGFEKPNKTEN